MDITKKTTVGEALPYLKKEHIEELLEKCDEIALVKPVFSFTVGEFIESLDEEYVMSFFRKYDEPLVVAIGRIKRFRNELEQIRKILSLNEIKLSPEEQAAQHGVVFPSFQENMLCECVEYFHLHSLDEAENIPLSNYLIMKRKKGAEALYERNLNRQYLRKQSNKHI